jgi:hypothetical protein
MSPIGDKVMALRWPAMILLTVELGVLPSAIGYPDEPADTQALVVIEEICTPLLAASQVDIDTTFPVCRRLSAAGMIGHVK